MVWGQEEDGQPLDGLPSFPGWSSRLGLTFTIMLIAGPLALIHLSSRVEPDICGLCKAQPAFPSSRMMWEVIPSSEFAGVRCLLS